MALTKITGQVVDTTTDLVVGVTTVGGGVSAVDGFFSGIVTFSQGVSIGGTLTYEDVTNVSSVGNVTVGSGITLSPDGNGFFTGIITATTFSGVDTDKISEGNTEVETVDTGSDGHVKFTTEGTERARIIADGKFGVNTDSPEATLSVDGSIAVSSNGTTVTPSGYDIKIRSNTSKLGVHCDTASGTPIIELGTGGATGGQIYTSQATPLRLGANSAEHMRVEPAGDIKISNNLNVVGTVTATSYAGDGSGLTGISVGIATTAASMTGITTVLDLSKDDFKVTASGITTVDVRGGTEGGSHMLRIVNSGITTVGFSTYFLFPSGGTPALPTTDGAISLISFTVHRQGAVGLATQLLAGSSVNFS